MAWECLAQEVDAEVVGRTMRRNMKLCDYNKRVACTCGYINKDTCKLRLDFCYKMLQKYPKPEDWRRVRFLDKKHWALGPQGKLIIIRKPGQRYDPYCI